MNEIIKKDIISILMKVKGVLEIEEERDAAEMRELSNHTIHNSSIFQDEDSISIAILVYAMSKVIERRQGGLDYKPFLDLISDAADHLNRDDTAGYRKDIKGLFNLIRDIDSKLKLYVEEVINQAQIKKAGMIYGHGISLGRTAEMLRISQWELLNYIGKTMIHDTVREDINVRDRLKFARGLFS